MHGVGQGSLLGGRYVTQQRVSQNARFERWTAADQTLDRDVVLLCFEAEGAQASAALDAARRAAGLEEPRLVRVLDVGSKDGVAFVVEEPLTGAVSMAALLGTGGLPSEEARRIVGEAAAALESARVRGLHHQVLTPRSVLRLEDGSVKVRGLATEAALLEAEESGSERASRQDAVALVALTYAVLTGRWPLPDSDSGLEDAPRVVGGVAAPSEIAAGVPADLDLIARQTLNDDLGPLSPGDLAGQIAPWSPTPLGSSLPQQPRFGNRTEPLERDPATRGIAVPPADPRPPRAASPAPRTPRPKTTPTPRSDGRTVLGLGIERDREEQLDSGQFAPGQLEEDPEAGRRDGAGRHESPRSGRHGPVGGAVAAGAAGGAIVAKGVGAAIAAAGTAAGSVGSSVGGLARSAADRAAERSAARAERRHTEGLTEGTFDGQDVRLSETLETAEGDLEPPVPLLAGRSSEPLDRDQSKVALMVVAGFVLLAALVGFLGLPRLGGGGGDAAGPLVTRTVTSSPTTTAAGGGTPSPSAAPASAPPVAIVSGQAWDPEGDNQEGNASVPRSFDGKKDTLWRSQAYASAPFGGFPKKGIGLILDLGQQTDVHQVVVDLVGGPDLTAYVASKVTLDGATSIGTSTGRDGTVTFTVPNGGAVKGQLIILWFTKLAPDGEGTFRAQVAEVRVS